MKKRFTAFCMTQTGILSDSWKNDGKIPLLASNYSFKPAMLRGGLTQVLGRSIRISGLVVRR